ncbi:MAG: hypothetical protein ABII90_04540 [Bacteroidota bacterium]
MSSWTVNEPSVAYGDNKKALRAINNRMPIDKKVITILPYSLNAIGINKYTTLYYKLSKIGKLTANWDNENAMATSQKSIDTGRILINVFEEMNLIEKNIAIHIFPAFKGGIQFEIDGEIIKADIEASAVGSVFLTKYSGKENKASEYNYDKNNIQELKNDLLS